MTTLAPVSRGFLPYGRQHVTDDDIAAVTDVLRSDWLTQGPTIERFEGALAQHVGASYAVACANGTAALHLSMMAAGIGYGDVVVTSPNTFLATANAARFVGAEVCFADIDPRTGLIDTHAIERLLKEDAAETIKAIAPVHFAGQVADLATIRRLAERHGAMVIDDGCHAIGSWSIRDDQKHMTGGNPDSDMTCFSFHPVKHVAMGEGGAIVTSNPDLHARLKRFRNHGMSKEDFVNPHMALSLSGATNPWYYEMAELGYNYRLTDIQAALGLSQLGRLDESLARRNELARSYTSVIADRFDTNTVSSLDMVDDSYHAYHLYVVQIDFDTCGIDRAEVMTQLRAAGIGTQVHYIPVFLQPYYQRRYGFTAEDYPGAMAYYHRALSLPMYPELTNDDVEYVVDTLATILKN